MTRAWPILRAERSRERRTVTALLLDTLATLDDENGRPSVVVQFAVGDYSQKKVNWIKTAAIPVKKIAYFIIRRRFAGLWLKLNCCSCCCCCSGGGCIGSSSGGGGGGGARVGTRALPKFAISTNAFDKYEYTAHIHIHAPTYLPWMPTDSIRSLMFALAQQLSQRELAQQQLRRKWIQHGKRQQVVFMQRGLLSQPEAIHPALCSGWQIACIALGCLHYHVNNQRDASLAVRGKGRRVSNNEQ